MVKNLKSQDRLLAKKSLSFLFSYKREVFILSAFSLLSSSFFLAAPFLSKLFIDKAFLDKNFAKFLQLSIWSAVIFVCSIVFNVLSEFIKNKQSLRVKFNLSSRFIRKFYSLDFNYLQERSAGENAFRIMDVEMISYFLTELCPHLLSDLIKLVLILSICLWLNFKMTAVLLVLSPLFLLNSLYIQNKMRVIYEEMWNYSARLSQEIYEAFSRILVIKVFGLEKFMRKSYLLILIKSIRLRIKSFRWGIFNSVVSGFLSKGIFGIITLYGGWLIIKGRLTLGGYTAIMLYLTQLGGLIETLSLRWKDFVQQAVSLDKFFEIMEAKPLVKEAKDAVSLDSLKSEIALRGVSFGYAPGKKVIKDVSLIIPARGCVGIAGPSGCGKTTLVNLILRLYDPWQGEIVIDGLDLRNIKFGSLRSKFAIATQEPLLFSTSIKENICFGLKGIPESEIVEVAKACRVYDYIMQLPQGFESLLGENAHRLSQGLKQRVALARALVRKPEILILDEATASVDSLTEEMIFEYLKKERRSLCTIIISHRLSAVKDADLIHFFAPGNHIESGTHEELLEGSPSYKDFFHNQVD